MDSTLANSTLGAADGAVAPRHDPILKMYDHGGYLVFDEKECRAAGKALHDRYADAKPFPHIAMEDLIDRDLLRRVIAEFPLSEGHSHFERAQERLKYQFAPRFWTGPASHNLFAELNSQAFVSFLEEMTGIKGLIVDPAFVGGGFHETKSGGHLGVHADFNINKRLGVIRQLNLLIYLNDEWPESYRGNLELWDREMKACEVSVLPALGKSVVFTTSLDSFHGQPDPVACPPDRSRRSMALYYYKATEDGLATIPDRTTNFRSRPASKDQADLKVKMGHLINDWTPPAVRRMLGRKGKTPAPEPTEEY